MIVSLVVAMSENRVIGRGGSLPWHLPADLKRFKQITSGHTIIMGRKTFESIGRPLPQRRSIVITHSAEIHAPGVETARSLQQALDAAGVEAEVFVIGGGDIFRQALPVATRVHLTLIHAQIAGDTYFPELDERQWRLVADECHAADEKNPYPHSFRTYERQRSR